MMQPPENYFAEFRDLLDALCEGIITPAQMQRLEELVLAHPEAEAYYVQYMNLDADLACHFAARSDRPVPWQRSGQDQPRHRARPARLRWLLGAVGLSAVAAGLLLAVALWPRPGDSSTTTEALAERNDDTVAVLLRAPGAVWQGSDRSMRPGTVLSPGRLRLESGVAHIEFYSGATVILEGPADFELISASEAFCARGKLRATVPPQAAGFTIRSPRLDLVDRGTEFGLLVDGRDRTEIHVFQGKVEWSGTVAVPAAAPRELTTGRGIRLEGAAKARVIKSDPAAFLSVEKLTARLNAETQQRHKDWLVASAALRKDPSLEVSYSFQAEQPWSRTLRNLAPARPQSRDGVIVGCNWAPGRWLGKDGLEFKRVSDRVRFNLPGEFGSMTLMAWVRVDDLPNVFNSLMMTDGWKHGAPHWHIRSSGKIGLGVRGSKQRGGPDYLTPAVITRERLGQWLHLAVIYDREGWVTHYVNGQPVAEESIHVHVPLNIGNAELGNWNVGPHQNSRWPIRYFTGCIDEFMFFSRAVTENEIKQIYNRGQPPQ
jgi:hypothetical protein